jgi:hypothetical protein
VALQLIHRGCKSNWKNVSLCVVCEVAFCEGIIRNYGLDLMA